MSIAKNLAHVLFTGPLFVYVGLAKPDAPWLYRGLLALAALLAAYFAYLVFALPLTQYHAFLALHLLAIVPLLAWVGYKGRDAPGIAFSLMLAVGCAAIGYHAIRLAQRIAKKKQ